MLLVVVVVDVAMREKSGRWGGLGGWKRQQGGRDVLIMHSSTWEVWWNSKWFDLWRLAKQPIYSSVSAVNRHRHVPAPSLPHPRHCRSPSPALSHTRLNICAHSRNTSLGSVYLLYRFFLFFCVFFFYFFAEYCHRRLNRCFWSLSGMPSLPTVRRCSSSGPHSFTHFGLSVRNSRKVNCPRRVNTVRHPATALPSPAEHTYVYKHYE